MKVGILTHYYNSVNYGGNLQAYALCKVLEAQQVEVQQISYDMARLEGEPRSKKFLQYSFRKKCRSAASFVKRKLTTKVDNIRDQKIKDLLESRKQSFESFNKVTIPHSRKVYTDRNIIECVPDYDVFVVGSDQVWNLRYNRPAFFLNFVPEDKAKFSYAASVVKTELTSEEQSMFQKTLQRYIGVSVRERDAVELLENLSPVPVEWVLDPTLLLTREEWDQVCDQRQVEGDYLFCYFLGQDAGQRELATQFARSKGLKIVTLPHLLGHYRSCDVSFGDEQRYDVSPNQLLSLIKYAKFVMTDSFHATVFSHIYQREYFVFERAGRKSMSSRIYSLTSLLESQDRFCDTPQKATLSYLESLPRLDYTEEKPRLEEQKKKSLDYLRKNLEKAEAMVTSHES